jgi:hypothetical protein
MTPLILGLVVLVLILIYAFYTRKTEFFEDSLGSQPKEIVDLVFLTKDIPNAPDRAMAIMTKFQSKQLTADEAIKDLYDLFMEGESSYKKMVAKPYVSYFTDFLDFVLKEIEKDNNAPANIKGELKTSIQNFKAKLAVTSGGAAAAVSSLTTVATAAVAPAPSESAIAANAAPPAATSTAPVMPAPTDARTLELINTRLNELGIKPNSDNMKKSGTSTAAPDSDAMEQGVEYDSVARGAVDSRRHRHPERPSCPEDNCDPACADSEPAPVDMNKYIRKDSIPCWGCTLPTTP